MLTVHGERSEAIAVTTTRRSSTVRSRARRPRRAAGLPAAAAASSTSAAGGAAAKSARAARAGRGSGDCARDAAVHGLEAGGQDRGLERRVADVPVVGRARVDALESLGPSRDAAENDRVGKELGEDLGLLGELLAVFLGRVHVEAESQRVLHDVAAGRRALRHESGGDDEDQPDQDHREADKAPSAVEAELEGREAADRQDEDAEASPASSRVIRARRDLLARNGVVEDSALRLLERRVKSSFQLRDLHLLAAREESFEERLFVRKQR